MNPADAVLGKDAAGATATGGSSRTQTGSSG